MILLLSIVIVILIVNCHCPWMSASFESCVLSSIGLCDKPISGPEESCQMYVYVCVCVIVRGKVKH
jgi:hypothetical protein